MLNLLWRKTFPETFYRHGRNTYQPGEGGGRRRIGKTILCALLMLLLPIIPAAHSAQDNGRVHFNIPRQRADVALTLFAEQAGISLIFPFDKVRDKIANRLVGEYPPQEAVEILLRGTGLTPTFKQERVLNIAINDEGNPVNTQRNILSVAMAYLMSGGAATYAVADDNNTAVAEVGRQDRLKIEEVVVTANKREERLQDTAMTISVLDSNTIQKRGLVSMGDYLSTVPGVTIQDRGAGANSIVMRGIAVSPQTERTAVGVYFGETPVSGMKNGANNSSSDLRMVDINRVEVLKGPQGTLYGADAMGGIVRIIPNEPLLNEVTGSVGAQYSNTAKFGDDNYQLQGVVNIPLIDDTLALRAVAYRIENSGYHKNIAGSYQGDGSPVPAVVARYGGITEDRDNVGNDTTDGVRVSALWQPTEQLSVNLSHIWQKIEQQGHREEDLSLPGRFQQVRLQPGLTTLPTLNGSGPDEDGLQEKVQLTSLTLDYDLEWGSLHSVSSWNNRIGDYFWDTTAPLSSYFPIYQGLANDGNSFTQEMRFVSELNGPFQVLAGLYYQDWESNYYLTNTFSGDEDKATLANANTGFNQWAGHETEPFYSHGEYEDSVEQKAAFIELSYNITEQLNATLGVRHYNYEQSDLSRQNGFFVQREELGIVSDLANDYSGETYKANLSWSPTNDTLLYAQWAEGFRIGKTLGRKLNESVCDADGNGAYEVLGGGEVPIRDGLDPDETNNYELGLKTSFVDNRITLNVAVYHIDWTGLPASVLLAEGTCGRYTVNVGKSTSKGVELESQIFLSDALKLNLSASYNEAKLSGESTIGEDGDDLPGSADANFSAGLEYDFDVSGYPTFVRMDYTYVGDYTVYLGHPDSLPLPGDYSQVHLKAGISLSNQLSLDLFVNNLTNADEITWVESVYANLSASAYSLRPRTIGLNLQYQFQ